jgi:hypothetical protein
MSYILDKEISSIDNGRGTEIVRCARQIVRWMYAGDPAKTAIKKAIECWGIVIADCSMQCIIKSISKK